LHTFDVEPQALPLIEEINDLDDGDYETPDETKRRLEYENHLSVEEE